MSALARSNSHESYYKYPPCSFYLGVFYAYSSLSYYLAQLLGTYQARCQAQAAAILRRGHKSRKK